MSADSQEQGDSAPPALVVLAAGASSRLGACKALVRLGGSPSSTPLARLLDSGAALGDRRPLLVVGAHRAELGAAAPASVEVVINARWAEGRTGSVAVAAAARPGRDLCLAPVDVPRVPRAVFAALALEWARAGRPERGWLAPRHAGSAIGAGSGRHGHPVILGRALARSLAALLDVGAEARPAWRDQPLSGWRSRAEPAWGLPVDAPEVLENLDTPADLERLRDA